MGMAFVTFENINHARQVLRDHKNSILYLKFKPPGSKLAMNPHKWRVWYAPPPKDIIWENLSNKNWILVKKIIANIFIFFVAFFLTTPQFLVHQLDPILNALKNITAHKDPFQPKSETNNTNPPLMEDFRYLPVWFTGVLPTFGFTSSHAYIDFLLKNNNLNWECIFLPDSGDFFVNYVITSSMLGSGLELIRFPELFWYLIQICMSRSKADTPAIRKAITYEFRFGEQYARM